MIYSLMRSVASFENYWGGGGGRPASHHLHLLSCKSVYRIRLDNSYSRLIKSRDLHVFKSITVAMEQRGVDKTMTLGTLNNTTSSTGRGGQLFKLVTWQHLSVERTGHQVALKASSCLRSLLRLLFT